MQIERMKNITVFTVVLLAIAFSVLVASPRAVAAPPPGQTSVIDLRDFQKEEVRSAGFTLAKDMTVHITALGGGNKSFWRELFDDERERMFASGWIIDAATRELVWEMTFKNTSGRSDRRSFDEDLRLTQGSYEVYFAVYGYSGGSTFSIFSFNIDRRPGSDRDGWPRNRSSRWRDDDDEDRYNDVIDLTKKTWGITLSVDAADEASVKRFTTPMQRGGTVFTAQKLGDNARIRKTLTLTKDLSLHIYALGEGRRKDGVYDYGWIIQRDTRDRVWEMTTRNSDYAGGAIKNIKFDGDVRLGKGTYELYYVTDDSHSNEDWNSSPPYDPYNYGIALAVKNEADRSAVTVDDVAPATQHAIVALTRQRDNDYSSAGFSLKQDASVRIYALGEMGHDRDLADYGWITEAKTRKRVWDMNDERTEHAGGAQKNRMVDDIIHLPKGDYVVYYQTDDSHAFNDWNSDAPFDEEAWGITVSGAGEKFDASIVASFKEADEQDVIAQITRVSDDRHLRKTFTLANPTKVRIYALGEGKDRRMYDYGWIEDLKTGHVVWEMTYNMTDRAGGSRKNRLVNTTITLEPGEYELHFETDDSHAFNDWNEDPPEDRTHWGITLYQDK